MSLKSKYAVTLLELMVVVMIIGILSSIAVTVYTGQVERARFAAARDTIRQLELAITRYEVDSGQVPPSSSGNLLAPNAIDAIVPTWGCGYLQVALLHSLSGDVYYPLSYRWVGPYLELDSEQLGDLYGQPLTSAIPKPSVQILDPWGGPYYYTRSDDYVSFGGTRRPPTDPYYDTETYYNPTTYQIFSMGPNGTTNAIPYRGLEDDDVNNW